MKTLFHRANHNKKNRSSWLYLFRHFSPFSCSCFIPLCCVPNGWGSFFVCTVIPPAVLLIYKMAGGTTQFIQRLFSHHIFCLLLKSLLSLVVWRQPSYKSSYFAQGHGWKEEKCFVLNFYTILHNPFEFQIPNWLSSLWLVFCRHPPSCFLLRYLR